MKKQSLPQSFRSALEGIANVFRDERNFKIHALFACGACAAAILLKIESRDFLIIGLAITLVIAAELVNTAVEKVVDIKTTARDPLAKAAKDAAAGAVLAAAVFSVVAGCAIFIPKIVSAIRKL